MLVVFILNYFLFIKYCQETPKKFRDLTYLLININEASPRTGNMLVVFISNYFLFIKYCQETPKKFRDLTYLLININEASP